MAVGLVAWLCGLRAWEHLGSAETSALGRVSWWQSDLRSEGFEMRCLHAAETIAAADENTRVLILDGVEVRSIRPGKGMGWCCLRIGRG